MGSLNKEGRMVQDNKGKYYKVSLSTIKCQKYCTYLHGLLFEFNYFSIS